MGARSAGIGNASVTITDSWAFFNNISGTSELKNMQASCTFQNRFGIKVLNTGAAVFIYPIKFGVSSLGLSKFGDSHYSVQKVSAGFGHKIGHVSLGIKADYLQVAIEELNTRRAFLLEFGGISEITKQLVFGAHVYNINQASLIGGSKKEAVPVVMKAGLSYRPTKKLMLNVETQKDLNHKPSFKTGVEYFVVEKFCLRTGISTQSFMNFFGIGFNNQSLRIDYAFSSYAQLGISNELSLSYKLRKK
ncbi:MAG TPA: hypothetical protein VNW99_13955 [Cytophagaceae bacterium]|nr:hypothetical protein [Cytophagaceae bacterium]